MRAVRCMTDGVALGVFLFSASAAGQAINMDFPVQHSVSLEGGAGLKRGFHTVPAPRPSAGADFIVPEVCTDANGLPNYTDPMSSTCTGKRKLRVGEPLTTYRTDFAWKQRYMNTLNIPLFKGKTLRVVNSRDWGSNSATPQEQRRYFDFDLYTGGDGYDVIEAEGQFVSAVGTADPVTNRKMGLVGYVVPEFFWFNQDCQPADGWVFYRSDIPLSVAEHTVAQLKGGSQADCAAKGVSKSSTIYHRYPAQTLTSGKKTETLASWHYGDEIKWLSPTSTAPLHHYEHFVFTRAYGLTRWERWDTSAGCYKTVEFHNQYRAPGAPPLDPAVECDPARIQLLSTLSQDCNGSAQANMFHHDFYRVSCRDWSYVRRFDLPQHPYLVPISQAFITSRNLLTQADFAEGRHESWKKYDGVQAGQVTSLSSALRLRDGEQNFALEIGCSSCLGNSIYQDVDPRSVVSDYGSGPLQIQLGARIGGSAEGHLSIVAFLFDSNGALVASPRAHVHLKSSQENVIAINFPWNFSNVPLSRIRYSIYMNRPGNYRVDDAFLAILPQN